MSTLESRVSAAALARAVDWVRGQIRKDRENRYSLVRDWTLPACTCSWWPDDIGSWESDLLRIVRNAPGVVTITIKAYHSTAADNICDGATLSPDNIPGIIPAAIWHDPWYYASPLDGVKTFEALALLFGISPHVTRKFGDQLFYSIARAAGCPRVVAALYYAGIRVGYPLARPFLLVTLCLGLGAGVAGCFSDGTFLDPTAYTPPQWEKVQ